MRRIRRRLRIDPGGVNSLRAGPSSFLVVARGGLNVAGGIRSIRLIRLIRMNPLFLMPANGGQPGD